MWGWHNEPGAWIWMALMMVLFWGGLAAAIMLVLRGLSPGGRGGTGEARSILENRYARGEIDEDEYRRRREVLDRRH